MSNDRPRVALTSSLIAATLVTGALAGTSAQAVTGSQAPAGAHPFTAKLSIGNGERSCTGALVDQSWLLSAASCFADDPNQPSTVPAGKPKRATTATIGRTDLTSTTGHVRQVVELVPRSDRDLVLARLDKPVTDITPLTIATDAPTAGETLTIAGYGRTKGEWAPLKLHTGTFTATGVRDGALDMTGQNGTAACAGDTGGPVLRAKDGGVQLVAVITRSWQAGCFGSDPAETRTSAVDTRVDDVADWVAKNRLATMHQNVTNLVTAADFNGDKRPDVAAILKDGNLHAFYTAPNGSLRYGRELWKHDGSWTNKRRMFGGDFNGDGRGDLAAINADGYLHLYPGTSSGQLGNPVQMWKDASWDSFPNVATYRAAGWTRDGLVSVAPSGRLYAYPTGTNGVLTGSRTEVWHDDSWNKKLISTSDYTSDKLNDIAAIAQTGHLHLYTGNARGTFDYADAMWPDPTWGSFPVIMGGDFNNDGKADLAAINSTGDLFLYPGDGKGKLGTRSAMWPTTG
ncbi:trypsin-like serine protease [Streptomyces monticola]|uniref:Trypsin-like serine protease n=1 Tax=Streptomyces monticola TaxID=2666263 RepID=A0ABW2JMY5_9ACTN